VHQIRRAKVVYVCNFNLVRSVVAEHVFRRRLEERTPSLFARVSVSSAGLLSKGLEKLLRQHNMDVFDPLYGRKLPKFVVEAMRKEEGIDLSSFRSQPLTEKVLKEAHLVIPVTKEIKGEIHRLWPWTKGKVLTVDEAGGRKCSDINSGQDKNQPYGWEYVKFGTYDPEDGSFTFPYEIGVSSVRKTIQAVDQTFEGTMGALTKMVQERCQIDC
jgi:protein-tyrosine-phosphatase